MGRKKDEEDKKIPPSIWEYFFKKGNRVVLKKNEQYGYYFRIEVLDSGELEPFELKTSVVCKDLWDIAGTISHILINGVRLSAETEELEDELRKIIEDIEEGKPIDLDEGKSLVYTGEKGGLLKGLEKVLEKSGLFEFVQVDRVFIRNVPQIVGQHKLPVKGQIDFLDKITLREGWVILYLYSLSDPNNILKHVEVDLREMYEGLRYTMWTGRGWKETLRYQIQELRNSLFELRKSQVRFTYYHKEKNQGEYRIGYVNILDYLGFGYNEKDLEGKEVVNLGTEEIPIIRPKYARPRRILFRLNAELMQGLVGKGMGFWKMSKDLFGLRDKLSLYEFQFVLWVLSQKEKFKDPYQVKIGRDKLIKRLGFRSKDRKRNEKTLLRAYEKSKELGILEGYKLDVTNKGGRGISDVFYRSDRFYFQENDLKMIKEK